jgi:hypothetical protein
MNNQCSTSRHTLLRHALPPHNAFKPTLARYAGQGGFTQALGGLAQCVPAELNACEAHAVSSLITAAATPVGWS